MNKGALEALVPVLKPLILYKGQQNDRRRRRAKNGSLLGRRSMHSMHKRRKGISSSAVIWYRVLFRQNRTDRPDVSFGAWCREIPLMKPGRRSPGGIQPTLLLPSRSIELTVAKPSISRTVPLIRARFSYRHKLFYHPIMQLVNTALDRKLAPGDRMRLLKSAANLQVIAVCSGVTP